MTLDGQHHLVVKGVHRAGERGFVDVVELSEQNVTDTSRCRSTPLLALRGEELVTLAQDAGLSEVQLFGNHAGEPHEPDVSPDLIIVARRSPD
jgi:hypothetical protein